uniref:Uncharacterized protein n=1 Tax=Romanomermis culicivorax TaxID=13658 RepID=A0A915I2D3_ROMCU
MSSSTLLWTEGFVHKAKTAMDGRTSSTIEQLCRGKRTLTIAFLPKRWAKEIKVTMAEPIKGIGSLLAAVAMTVGEFFHTRSFMELATFLSMIE